MRYCSKCGTSMEDTARFCPNCGTIAEVQPAAPAAPVNPAPEATYNPAPQAAYNPAPQAAYNPAPQTNYNPAPQTNYNPAPQTNYNPAPQTNYNPYGAPNTTYPTYQQPTQELATGDRVKGIVGMALGIASLALSVLGLIVTLVSMDSYYAEAFGAAIGYSIISLPCGIVGRIFSTKSAEAGNTSAMCSIGSKMGLAGIIVSAVMVFLGFISLLAQ